MQGDPMAKNEALFSETQIFPSDCWRKRNKAFATLQLCNKLGWGKFHVEEDTSAPEPPGSVSAVDRYCAELQRGFDEEDGEKSDDSEYSTVPLSSYIEDVGSRAETAKVSVEDKDGNGGVNFEVERTVGQKTPSVGDVSGGWLLVDVKDVA
jgi:hypothetical protein